MAVKMHALRSFAFFRPLGDKELERLARQLSERRYPARTTIFSDRQIGDKLYLLKSGTVEIIKPAPDGEVVLNVLRPGDHFGEMSLLDNQPRSAAARAATNVTVIEIAKPLFLDLVRRFPVLLYEAAQVSDQRLRQRDLDLIHKLTTHNQQLQKLYETSLDISRHLELEQALAAIVHRATDLSRSAAGALHLFDPTTRRLVAQPPFKAMRSRAGATGRAFAAGTPIIENKSRALAAPISLGAEPLGVLTVYRRVQSPPFTQDDANLLLLFANQSAIAIENARLYGLAVEKGRLDGELRAAREVQRRLLPTRAPRIPGFRLAGLWQPARQVAGDFYDFIPLGGGKFGIVIADVSDKGMPAALFMAATRSIVRASVVGEHDPGRALERANRLLAADATNGMFVTVFLGILDARARRFTYANAGHNPPLLWRARTHRVERLRPHGLALGILPERVFVSHQIELRAGDVLTLYTDGVTDAVNERDQSFGERRLVHLIQANARHDAAALTRAIAHAVREFTGARALFDDVAVVGLSVQNSKSFS